MVSITGKPPSQTAQLIDLAFAPAPLCRPVPWDKGRPPGTCTALSHRGKLEPCLSPLHQSVMRGWQAELSEGPMNGIPLPRLSSEPTKKQESQVYGD